MLKTQRHSALPKATINHTPVANLDRGRAEKLVAGGLNAAEMNAARLARSMRFIRNARANAANHDDAIRTKKATVRYARANCNNMTNQKSRRRKG